MNEFHAINPLRVAKDLAEMEFRELATFNAGQVGVFWSEAGGPSPWEMHPDCHEMLQVLEGEIEVEVLPADGGQGLKTRVPAGCFCVIPQGCWHRQWLLERSNELYLTPGSTRHSNAEDPRVG